MDNEKETIGSFSHGISISERKNVIVTGVKKIESFNNDEFFMDSTHRKACANKKKRRVKEN